MFSRARCNDANGALSFVTPVVVFPKITKDEFAEATLPFLLWAVVAVAVMGIGLVAADIEGVGAVRMPITGLPVFR